MILCFSQTGSGKSHSVLGSRNAPGLLPRLADHLVYAIANHNESSPATGAQASSSSSSSSATAAYATLTCVGVDANNILIDLLPSTSSASTHGESAAILAQTTLSIPNGAVSYATLECTKNALLAAVPPAVATSYRPVLDLVSSACGTLLTSLISVPQTVLLDRTMAGQYPSLGVGARRLAATEGLRGFYRGWAPAMISKIPSYALTWTFFQSAKRMHNRLTGQEATSPVANFVLGALASGLSVCVTIPMVRKDALSRGERDIRIDATTDCLLRSHFLRPN